jgi:hypothetical protein
MSFTPEDVRDQPRRILSADLLVDAWIHTRVAHRIGFDPDALSTAPDTTGALSNTLIS